MVRLQTIRISSQLVEDRGISCLGLLEIQSYLQDTPYQHRLVVGYDVVVAVAAGALLRIGTTQVVVEHLQVEIGSAKQHNSNIKLSFRLSTMSFHFKLNICALIEQ